MKKFFEKVRNLSCLRRVVTATAWATATSITGSAPFAPRTSEGNVTFYSFAFYPFRFFSVIPADAGIQAFLIVIPAPGLITRGQAAAGIQAFLIVIPAPD